MAIARLPVILILILYLLQNQAQGQLTLVENPSTGLTNSPSVSSDPRIAELIASVKNSQCQKCANNGPSLTAQTQQCNKQTQQAGQQILNFQLQPQSANVPLNFQPLALNIQPSTSQNVLNSQQALNLQQCANQNLQQSINLQPINPQPCINQNLQQQGLNIQLSPQQLLQQPVNQHQQQIIQQPVNQQQLQNLQQSVNQQQQQILQQPVNQQLLQNLQQLTVQQQSSATIPLNNLQIVGQQASTKCDVPISSLPMVNRQVQGLPSQVSQGVLLSNLGLTSALPSLLPAFSQSSADQAAIIPQNNVSPINNVPVTLLDGSKNTNSLPTSASPYFPTECALNIPSSLSLVLNPAASQQNQPSDLTLNTKNTVQCQQPKQQVNLQVQPIQAQPQYVQYNAQIPPSQAQPLQVQPTCSNQNQQTSSSDQNQPSLTSLLLSQLQSSNTNPQYQNSSPYSSNPNQGSKSSSMKTLLPLLFNLLKEKNCCGCPQNCNNCGCMNNNNYMQAQQPRQPCMNNNNNYVNTQEESNKRSPEPNNNNNIEKPHVCDGYSSQVNYGLQKEKKVLADNCVESEETEDTSKVQEQRKHQNYKKKKNDSLEYEEDDEYGDSYENED